MVTLWRKLTQYTRLRDVNKQAILAMRDDGTGVLMRFRHYESKKSSWNTIHQLDTRNQKWVSWRVKSGGATLRDALPEDMKDATLVAIPLWHRQRWARVLRVGLIVALMVLAVVLGLTPYLVPYIGVALLLLAPRFGPVHIRSLQQLPLTSNNIVEYAAQRIAGAHPEALEELPHREETLARIADIKAEYGELKLDVLTRIEQPALFDSAVPTTSRFLTALVRAEDSIDDLDIDQLEQLAARLEVAFEVAKDHAAAVGIAHLPEDLRDDGRRASKAARLAQAAASDGERRAATTQLNRILDSMALYYMPSVTERLEIEAPPTEGHRAS